MELPGKRIQKWREHLGKTPREFEALTGIPYTTLKTLENNTEPGKHNPSYDVLAKLRNAFPQLNIDWIFDEGGIEPMLREDRELVPLSLSAADAMAKQAATTQGLSAAAASGLTSGAATVEYADGLLLREQMQARIEGLEEDKSDLKQEVRRLREELGKPFNGLDAAGPYPTTPRNPIGFGGRARAATLSLSVSHRVNDKGRQTVVK